MTFKPARHAALALTLLGALTACEQGQQGADASGLLPAADTAAAGGKTEVREVEMPDVFSVSESALWDGRPSLGGIWVAHPDVTQPESVIIRNKANGKSVAGALFRRERNNPGPRIQVSSDAAAALGMLAGQPAELSVIAVRREEIVTEPAPAPVPEATPDAAAAGKASAAAAPEARPDGAAEAAAAGTAAAATAETAKKPGFWERLRSGRSKKPATDIATEADTKSIEAATAGAAVPDVETKPLDPVASSAAAAIDKAEAKPAAKPEAKPDTKPEAKPRTAAAAPAPAPASGGEELKSPFVQVGLFGEEANATSAATSLRQAGIVPTVDKTSVNGKTFWRVLVGPMTTESEQSALLAQVKGLGYSDAYLVAK